jgi:site-specific DNA recombinase
MCESCRNGGKPLAAIWWRVSTEAQKEISPDTQVKEALALAQTEGYEVPQDYIIGTDWHSLSVWESPAMERVKALIRQREIQAVFMYDADRAPSKPAHRLLLRALCEEYGVKVRCKYGQVPDGDMGEVMEFLSAWAKEKQVHRAQKGAADGLRDRARLHGLPVNGHAPYGYRFQYRWGDANQRIPVALEPDPTTYPVACTILRMAMDGESLRSIIKALFAAGIPTRTGVKVWHVKTLGDLVRNPIYAGRYYALRQEAVVPGYRVKQTYGKSATRLRAEDEWVWLRDFPIISPIMSWEQREAMLARLPLNKRESRRNAKTLFILGGMLFCAQDGRRLSGRTGAKGHEYFCPRRGDHIGGPACDCPRLNGAIAEGRVWSKVCALLSDPVTFTTEMELQRGTGTSDEAHVRGTLETLRKKLNKVASMETELLTTKLRDLVSEEAVQRAGALLKAERTHYTEEMERQQAVLATLQQNKGALESLVALRDRIVTRLESATPEDKRWVLETLSTRITVSKDSLAVSVGVPGRVIAAATESVTPLPGSGS